MKNLLSTTALALALGLPSLAFAQTTAPAQNPTAQSQAADMQGFLTARSQADVLASELMGHDVYALRAAADRTSNEDRSTMARQGTHDRAMMNRADLGNMENIGKINEIVLSHDGQVRAIVIGVGGFLGMGEQDIAVTMDQVTFASDAEDRSQMYIIVNTSADMLEGSPRYDRTAMADQMSAERAGAPAANRTATATDRTTADRTAFTRPEMTREGYNRLEITQVSSDVLVGKSVYDVNDNSVGSITNLILDDAGAVTNVIIDFGGFLGIGSSQVALNFDELTILANEGNTSVRVYVDATKEQIQGLPQYQAMN